MYSSSTLELCTAARYHPRHKILQTACPKMRKVIYNEKMTVKAHARNATTQHNIYSTANYFSYSPETDRKVSREENYIPYVIFARSDAYKRHNITVIKRNYEYNKFIFHAADYTYTEHTYIYCLYI